MGLRIADLNSLLDAMVRAVSFTGDSTLFMSLHTADPGTTLANEVTGGSYARQALAFSAAASGMAQSSGALNYTSMPATTVRWVAIASASTAGSQYWSAPLIGTRRVFTAATSDTFTAPAHGFANNQQVRSYAIGGTGSVLPTGITTDTAYYVISAATDTFQLSLSSGGAAIDITASGAGEIALDNAQAISAGNTLQFLTADIDAVMV